MHEHLVVDEVPLVLDDDRARVPARGEFVHQLDVRVVRRVVASDEQDVEPRAAVTRR